MSAFDGQQVVTEKAIETTFICGALIAELGEASVLISQKGGGFVVKICMPNIRFTMRIYLPTFWDSLSGMSGFLC